MKYFFYILFFCFLSTFSSLAQVNSDSISNNSKFIYDSANSYFFKSLKKLSPITQSVNYIEIRIFSSPFRGDYQARILAYDKNGWHALEGTYFPKWNQKDIILLTQSQLIPKRPIKEIITQLDSIDLLHLKSSNEIKTNLYVDDGISYHLFYKKGSTYKEIYMNNPMSYLEEFPTQDEFKKYVALINIFFSEFKIQ